VVHVEESFMIGAGGATRRHHTLVVHVEESFMVGAGGARAWISLRPTTRVSSLLVGAFVRARMLVVWRTKKTTEKN
jgi:hypothetical protein